MSWLLDLVFANGQSPPVSGLAIAGLLLYGLYFLSTVGRRDKRLPPGPPTLPILGNLHLIPKTNLAMKFKLWGEKYGGVFSLKFGPSTIIVLFDRKAVNHLLDKKGAIYSERPASYVPSLVTGGDSVAFMNTTPLWRWERRVAVHNLSPRQLEDRVGKIQNAESIVFLSDLLKKPDGYYGHIKRLTASVASAVVFGSRGPDSESFWSHAVYDAMDNYNAALEVGANPPVDEFPFLQWIPDFLAPWKRRAKYSYKCMDKTWNKARRLADARRQKGIKRDSIIDNLLDGEKMGDFELTDHQLNHFLGVLVEGAADTTAAAMLTSVMNLAVNPQFQEKARKQLDAVCGTSRLPKLSDMEDVPYINCIIKEAMRIHPVLPQAIPHRVLQDDYYEGYLIPKNATIILPSWAMHMSETQGYKNAEAYNPDRFIGFNKFADSYAGSPDYENRDHYGYGAGRRVCPGIHLAERTQWTLTSRILWAFEIGQKIDSATGKPIPIDVNDYYFGMGDCPKPFSVVFKPRSQAHIDVIKRELTDALEFLKAWDD